MGETTVHIDGGDLELRLGIAEDGRIHQLGFGPELAEPDPAFPVGLHPLAHPTFGEEPLREPALRITHTDGATSTRLRHRSTHREPEGEATLHRIGTVDRAAPVAVDLCWRAWPERNVVEQWVEVVNEGTGPITVHRAASGTLAFAGATPHLTHWGGGWAAEWTETTEALHPGTKTVSSAGSIRSSLHREPIVLLAPDGPATETTGTVYAATTVWAGDTRVDAEIAMHRQGRLLVGAQWRGAERTLEPGERLVTPTVLWTASAHGIGPTSRTFHRWIRDRVLRDGHRDRATVVNTWEAVFFDLDPEGLRAQVDVAAEVGGELFLLDDGWFGGRHPRNDDTSSLGDWQVDRSKLPDGLQPLIDHTLARGLRFGLWVEPEMINATSELYEAHPDWVIGEPGRDRREERNQLILDICQTEVAQFVVGVIDQVLAEHTGITYLKWDANRDTTEPGSTALGADRQHHQPHDRVRAALAIFEEVARRHPEVELMICASGGGRSDLATLAHGHEQWTSDNTDALDRVRIQWGASHLLPGSVTAAHATRWNARPLDLACATALGGRFGLDLDLRTLTDQERRVVTEACATAARIRPLVQRGELHRLHSPVGSDRAALVHLATDGTEGVVFLHRLEPAEGAAQPEPVPLPGLDPTARYRITDRTPHLDPAAEPLAPQIRTGADLAEAGLGWPEAPAPCARILLLEREG